MVQPRLQGLVASVIPTATPHHGRQFRLLHRLLTPIARLLDINALREMSHAVVEAARESLVIGQA